MTDEPRAAVERLRPKLMAVAYRMLGTVADAEDAVQDAYLRYHQHASGIGDPEGWLVKATTRRCIDRLRKAKREEYVGPWLPEPVPETWAGAAVEDRAELAESLSVAFLVLLETLTPAERAAYLLREVFGYEYGEIADLLGKSPENARQIAARAKRRLGTGERRFTPAVGQADAPGRAVLRRLPVGRRSGHRGDAGGGRGAVLGRRGEGVRRPPAGVRGPQGRQPAGRRVPQAPAGRRPDAHHRERPAGGGVHRRRGGGRGRQPCPRSRRGGRRHGVRRPQPRQASPLADP